MKAEVLLAAQRAMKEYYSDPQLMNDITIEQHIADCISGLVEKLSYASPTSSGVQTAGQEDRKTILLKAAFDLLKKCKDSHYVLDVLEQTVFYDGADCDGSCLMDDIALELDIEVEY